jgi:hypothetical protein
VKTTFTEELYVTSDPVPWWRWRARREARRSPAPEVPPGELYVGYGGDRDLYGNVHFVLYWNEPWCRVWKGGVSTGCLKARFFYCDDRPLYPSWLTQYNRVVNWPDGADITGCIRETP